jgi:hypothetical protein
MTGVAIDTPLTADGLWMCEDSGLVHRVRG